VLLNPIIGRFGSGPAFDLTDRLSQPLPPTLIIHGTADRVSPIAGVERFAAKAKSAGSPDVRVIEYPQRGHGFWNFQGGRNPDFGTTEAQIAGFFDRIGWK
jgi:acetyl esterase/lipase